MIHSDESHTWRWRRNIGNRANHSTANDKRPNTSRFVSSLEANSTEAKMAAFVDNDPGILPNHISLLAPLVLSDTLLTWPLFDFQPHNHGTRHWPRSSTLSWPRSYHGLSGLWVFSGSARVLGEWRRRRRHFSIRVSLDESWRERLDGSINWFKGGSVTSKRMVLDNNVPE